jgi:hypothetical protein
MAMGIRSDSYPPMKQRRSYLRGRDIALLACFGAICFLPALPIYLASSRPQPYSRWTDPAVMVPAIKTAEGYSTCPLNSHAEWRTIRLGTIPITHHTNSVACFKDKP